MPASFSSGHRQRDKDVKSANLLHVQEHPHIKFESSQLVPDGDGWVLRGQLTAPGNAAPVELAVTDTEPGFQGDRVSGARKPATLQTGLVVQVPLFVNSGDAIKVDTRSGEYLTRA